MSNLIGPGINQIPTNGMLGNMAFQDKTYVSVDKVGIGSTFVDSGTSGQILQVYGGGAYIDGNVGVGTTNPQSKLSVVGNVSVSGVVTASSFSGNASVTQLQSTGVSTFINGPVLIGGGTSTGTSGQVLQLVGVNSSAYIGGSVGIGTTTSTNAKLSIVGDVNINGIVSFSSTIAQFISSDVRFTDQDLTLNLGPTVISNDTTADSAGISVASTEGSPLVNLNITAAETSPSTYKKFMWFKNNASGLGTDAWLSNYAIGIGSTQFPTGTRLAAGNVQISQNDITTVRNINASGIATASQLDLTANAVANDSVLYLSGTVLGTNTKNGILGIGQLGFNDTDIIANFTHSVNSYAQIILQNTTNGTSASSDFIVNNNQSTGTQIYGDFGINATAFTGGGPFGDGDGTYLYSAGGTLSVGTNDAQTFRIATGSATNTPVTRMTVSSGSTTYVGIGTSTPTRSLHIFGNSSSTAGNAAMTITNLNSTGYGVYYGLNATGVGGRNYHLVSNGPLDSAGTGKFSILDTAASADRLVIDTTGNIGLASTNPTARLNIGAGTTAANGAPLKINAGSVLTSVESNAIEYDGVSLYTTGNDLTNGSRRVPIQASQYFRLNADGSTLGITSATWFGSTNRPALISGYTYQFEYHLQYVKVTNGAVSFVFSSSVANGITDIQATTTLPQLGAAAPYLQTGTGTTIATNAPTINASTGEITITGIIIPSSNIRLDLLANNAAGTLAIKKNSWYKFTPVSVGIGTTSAGNIA